MGRPKSAHPRDVGVFVRFSRIEAGAVVKALGKDHPNKPRPSLPEYIRSAMVSWASNTLGVNVTRSALLHEPGGVADFKRWRLARAARKAAGRRRVRRK